MCDSNCPSGEELLAYAVGRLPDETLELLADHTRNCHHCQAKLTTIDVVGDTLISRLRRPVVVDQYEHEPHCHEAVARVKAMADGPASGAPRDMGTQSQSAALGQLGEYRLLEKLGEGGMGVVYKAFHTKLGRLVALKVLPKGRLTDRQMIARFEREMRAVGALDHPNIVRAHDAREVGGTLLLAMEFVDGLDLSKLLAGCGPLPIADACELVRQTALGLQAAHENGMVHRDVKPSNLILSVHGHVKVLDLGLARFQIGPVKDEGTTASDQAMGTADYVAPEQIRDSHTVDIRADIYGLGCTLYTMLTGCAPFGGPDYTSDFDKMTAHIHSPVQPIRRLRSAVPDELAAVIGRMLAKDPSERYGTPAEVADALAPLCTDADLLGLLSRAEQVASSLGAQETPSSRCDQSASSAPVDTRPKSPRRAQPPPLPARRPWRAVAVAVGVFALALGGLWAVQVTKRARDSIAAKDAAKVEDLMIPLRLADGRDITIRIPAGTGGLFRGRRPGDPDRRTRQWKSSTGAALGEAEFLRLTDRRIVALKRNDGTAPMIPFEKLSLEDQKHVVREVWPITVGSPIPRPEPATVSVSPEVRKLPSRGRLSGMAMVTHPAALDGVRSWTLETIAHRGFVGSVEYRHDGSLLATACEDGVIRLWDTRTGEFLRALVAHDDAVACLTWSPDGRYLASGSRDGTIRFWDVQSASLLRTVQGHAGGVTSIAWSPDGRWLASGGADVRVRVWDVSSEMTPLHSWPNCAVGAWSPDGKRLACVGGLHVKVWDVESHELRDFAKHTLGAMDDLVWSPDGRYLAAAAWRQDVRKNSVNLWDAETGKLIAGVAQGGWRHGCLAWSPDGRSLLVAVWSVNHTILVYDLTTGDFSRPWGVARNPELPGAGRVAFSPDGATFAVTFSDGTVEICDSQMFRPLLKLPGGCGALLADGRVVGRAVADPTAPQTPREEKDLGALVALPQNQNVLISPDGHYTGPPGVDGDLVYVVQTTQGHQETLTRDQFHVNFGWTNDPRQADAQAPAGDR